jgi:hypothetical protein
MSTHPTDDQQDISAMRDVTSDEKAALDEVEPDRLLAGEDEKTRHIDDAIHWVKVYKELLEFKRSVLATTEEHVGTMDPDASAEVQKTDLKALHAEALRFERRLVFWRTRIAAMQGESERSSG